MNLGPRCAVRSAAEAEEGLRDIWMSGNTCRMLGASPHAVPEERGRFKDALDIGGMLALKAVSTGAVVNARPQTQTDPNASSLDVPVG